MMEGYEKLVSEIYSGKEFYERTMLFLKDYSPAVKNKTKVTFRKFMALIKSMAIIGILDKNRKYYWKLFFWSLFKRSQTFPLAITYSIYGYHFRKVYADAT